MSAHAERPTDSLEEVPNSTSRPPCLASSAPVLVTGATGLLGNQIARALLASGQATRVLVREGSDPRPCEELELEIVRGDLCDPKATAEACDGAAFVIHAAGEVRIGRSNPERFQRNNVDATRNLVSACLATGARMVQVSTTDTLGSAEDEASPVTEDDPFDPRFATPYSLSKLKAEEAVRQGIAEGLDAVVVHPSFLLGPRDWKPSSGAMLLAAARGLSPLAPRGLTSVADARDVAAGILAAARSGRCGRHYILAGETLSYLDLWTLCARIAGARPPLGNLGPVLAWLVGAAGDAVGAITGTEPPVNSVALRSARAQRHYSSQRAERELSYSRRPLEETLRDTWQWFLETGCSNGRNRKPHPRD